MIICKFTHDTSLLCDGMRFWILGPGQGTDNSYDLYRTTDGIEGDIVSAVNLDEGLCHIVLTAGSVFQIEARKDYGFTLQKVKNP